MTDSDLILLWSLAACLPRYNRLWPWHPLHHEHSAYVADEDQAGCDFELNQVMPRGEHVFL